MEGGGLGEAGPSQRGASPRVAIKWVGPNHGRERGGCQPLRRRGGARKRRVVGSRRGRQERACVRVSRAYLSAQRVRSVRGLPLSASLEGGGGRPGGRPRVARAVRHRCRKRRERMLLLLLLVWVTVLRARRRRCAVAPLHAPGAETRSHQLHCERGHARRIVWAVSMGVMQCVSWWRATKTEGGLCGRSAGATAGWTPLPTAHPGLARIH